MKMIKNWMFAGALLVAASMAVGVGCSGDDEDKDSTKGLSTCEALCQASIDAGCDGAEAQCAGFCAQASSLCETEADAYLECGKDYETVTCFDGIPAGVITDCAAEGAALQLCLTVQGGFGGAGGAGGAGN